MNSSIARRFAQVIAVSGLLVAALSACTGSTVGHTSAPKPDRPATSAAAPVAATPTASAPVHVADAPDYAGPHFSTPQAAMSYLTGAYNHDDAASLHAVTTPQAFKQLTTMRTEAVDLQVQSCVPSGSGRGDYVCTFRHDYPASLHKSGYGSSRILVAPALNPGWYMYKLLDCG